MKKAVWGFFMIAAVLLAAAGAWAAVEPPLVITTCGQSPGAVMAKMSCLQAKLSPTESDNQLSAEGIKGKGYKTLMVTTGTSLKGMGAAGTDVDKEIDRVKTLIEAAKAEGMMVIGAHIEGMARRTDASDEASIKAVMPLADLILIVADSDKDGFFTTYAKELNKPLLVAKDALGVGATLAAYNK